MSTKKPSINARVDKPLAGVSERQLIWNIPLTEEQWETQACVYILSYNKKYLIVRAGRSLSGSLFLLEKEYGQFVSHQHEKSVMSDKSGRYFAWHKYIRLNPGGEFHLRVSIETEDVYKALMNEQALLNKYWGKDDNCMNKDPDAYIPKKGLSKGKWLAFKRYSKHV